MYPIDRWQKVSITYFVMSMHIRNKSNTIDFIAAAKGENKFVKILLFLSWEQKKTVNNNNKSAGLALMSSVINPLLKYHPFPIQPLLTFSICHANITNP